MICSAIWHLGYRMSSVFRRDGAETIEASGSWDLDEQIQDVAEWLDRSGNPEKVCGSILDIGFTCRRGAQVMVQGETIPVSFMQRLVALNIDLWLSIYPPFAEGGESNVDGA